MGAPTRDQEGPLSYRETTGAQQQHQQLLQLEDEGITTGHEGSVRRPAAANGSNLRGPRDIFVSRLQEMPFP